MNVLLFFSFSHRRRFSACLAAAVALGGWAPAAWAELQFVSDNSGHLWPGPDEAAVRTSVMPTSGSTRGVRGDRVHAQTFQVQEAFELDRIFLAYQWVGDENGGSLETNFTKIRIVEVDDVFTFPVYTAGAEVAAQVSFTILEEPIAVNPEYSPFYAIELKWNAEEDGPLLLTPREGNQGYALELTGTHTGGGSSAIALIERHSNLDPENTNGPYPFGRAFEMQPSGPAGPFTNGKYDFPMIMTAVPYAPGDFDHDGDVDGDDLATWETNFGSTEADSWTGDADSDGDADGNDFLVWQRNVTAPISEIAPVPEPATAGMAACGLVAAALIRGRWLRGFSPRRRA